MMEMLVEKYIVWKLEKVKNANIKNDYIANKAIAMMYRKSPRSEKIYLIENHCQANISK